MKRRLARLQRKLHKSASTSAMEQVRQRNSAKAIEVRMRLDELSGAELQRRLSQVEPAADSFVRKLSVQMNEKLELTSADPASRSWFKLFRTIDYDGSGRISFYELLNVMRDELRFRRSQISDFEIMKVWRSIDDDASGWISIGEFSRFMRIGETEMAIRRRVNQYSGTAASGNSKAQSRLVDRVAGGGAPTRKPDERGYEFAGRMGRRASVEKVECVSTIKRELTDMS